MAKLILIMGESGSGKTTSLRTLDPKSTFYFDADKKGLSWRGWKSQYSAEAKNYFKSSDGDQITRLLAKINEKPEIKHVVIDTINAIMIDDEFARMKDKNYDKWLDLAASIYGMITYANTLRDDLTVIFVAHSQTERDDYGNVFTRVKTSGRKLDKIVVESKFTTVLLAKRNDGGEYVLETHSKNSTVKTPMGAFDADEIPNDIQLVLEGLKDY